MHRIALLLATVVASELLLPLFLVVAAIGALAWWRAHLAAAMLDILPLKQWPMLARTLYTLL